MKFGFPQGDARPPSLTRRMLGGMVLPMAGVAILLGVGGAWAIEESVEAVNDRILSAASRAIAESLAVEDGEITLDLPPSAFAMMENAERDNVYYSISYQGKVISGYSDLPRVEIAPRKEGEVTFDKAEYRGRKIRMVSEIRRLPRIDGLVTVEVAETMDARDRVIRSMLLFLALLEAMLIGLSAVLLPIAVRWGLSPLRQLRGEMERRSAADFTPLPIADVPTELRDFVGTFNGLLGRLEAAVQGMRRFTADASHQMRTPLTILRTHVAVLEKAEPGSEDARASLSDISHATERLQNLLVQLLALARADSAAPARPSLEPVDVVEIARSVANDHVAEAMKHDVHLEFSAASETSSVLSHATWLTEILANLIDNAIRYNRPGGEVRIGIADLKDELLVSVEDDGPGIAPADRERVFERFTRLHPELNRTGTGLGLPVVKALAEVAGATVSLADAATGTGLRVELRLRKAPEEAK